MQRYQLYLDYGLILESFDENMSNVGLTGRKNYYMELADIYNNIMFNIKPDNWRN